MELAGGGWHAQLNASMVPCLAVFVGLFITIMAKSVKTSLDDSLAAQSSEQFWSNLFSEAQFLCTPSRDCEDRSPPYPSIQNNLSLAGPNSCSPLTATSLNHVMWSRVGRAEGSRSSPRQLGEHASSDVCETLRLLQPKPRPSKKSWLRAVRRVLSHGQAQYHGRWFRRSQLSVHDIQSVQSRLGSSRQAVRSDQTRRPSLRHTQADSQANISGRQAVHVTHSVPRVRYPAQQQKHSTKRRAVPDHGLLRFISVNCGGLPAHKLDEILYWADVHQVDVLAIQETRWRSSLTWKSSHWSLIHSGPDTKAPSYCGVLFAFRGSADLRFEAVVPGRLLRVQVSQSALPLPLEVLIAYNFYLDDQAPGDVHEAKMQARHSFWTALDSTLRSIPRRHSLLLLGDLNLHANSAPPCCPLADPSGHVSCDNDHFQEILCSHMLRTVPLAHGCRNTTYRSSIGQAVGSRPDYVITRASMLHSLGQVRAEWTLPFLSPNELGWHCALLGYFRRNWTPWSTSRPAAVRTVRYNQALVRAAQSPEHPLHQRFQDDLAKALSDRQLDLSQLSSVVHDVGRRLFADKPCGKQRCPPWKSLAVQELCRKKWASYSLVRHLATPKSLLGYFRCWQVLGHHLSLSRQCQRASRSARRSWLNSLCDEAEQSGRSYSFSFYPIIRKLARSPLGYHWALHAKLLEPLLWSTRRTCLPTSTSSYFLPHLLMLALPRLNGLGLIPLLVMIWRVLFRGSRCLKPFLPLNLLVASGDWRWLHLGSGTASTRSLPLFLKLAFPSNSRVEL